MTLNFNGRSYEPERGELEALADDLERRAQPAGGIYRHVDDATFGPLATRIRDALEPPEIPIELEAHEAAALVLATVTADVPSTELDRFRQDYLAENEWTQRPMSSIFNLPKTISARLGFKIGQWFFEDGLQAPIGGLDDETGEDLPPGDDDFAMVAGANSALADVASMWSRTRGRMLADERVVADEVLRWLREEREAASATAQRDDVPVVDQARAAGRAWALREAALWLETAANSGRLPWEPPRHQA